MVPPSALSAPRVALDRALNAIDARAFLGVLLILAAALLLHYTRHLTFFYDEWNFILLRRGESVSTYLGPHNGHLSLFPVVVYKVLFGLVGLRHYTPYVLVLIGLHLFACWMLYEIARPRLGQWLALLPAGLLLFMGSAYQDLLWAFQIGYLGSVAGGLAAIRLLDNRTRRSDQLASAALVWSVCSSGVGIPFLFAAAVMLACERSSWRRWWVVAVPAGLFAIWYLGWGGGEEITSPAVLGSPQYVASAAGAASAGILGLTVEWGPALIALLAVAVSASWHQREDRHPTPLVLAAIGGALCFWLLSAVVRVDSADPTASRYVYIGAVFIWLLLAEARLGARMSTPWLLGLVLIAAGGVVSNIGLLRSGSGGFAALDESVRASLTAVQVAARQVPRSFQPSPVAAPQITAGPYLAAVRDLGSPAYTVPELRTASESLRETADQTIQHAESLELTPGAIPAAAEIPVSTTARSAERLAAANGCIRARPTGPAASFELTARAGTTVELTAAKGPSGVLLLRRFASAYTQPVAAFGAGSHVIHFPADLALGVPWHLRVSSASPTVVCAT